MGNFNLLSTPPSPVGEILIISFHRGEPKKSAKTLPCLRSQFRLVKHEENFENKKLVREFLEKHCATNESFSSKKSRSYWTTEANTLKPILNEGCKKAARKARHCAKATQRNALSTVMTLHRNVQKALFSILNKNWKGKPIVWMLYVVCICVNVHRRC